MFFLVSFLILSSAFADSFKIGVADSGVEISHPLLKTHIEIIEESSQVLLKTPSSISDEHGHGTHVAGILVKNLSSVDYKIVPFKNITAKNKEDDSDCLEDMGAEKIVDFAIAHNIKVLNFSQTMGEYSDKAYRAFQKANEHGILIVAASGNKSKMGSTMVHALDLSALKRAYEVVKKKDPTVKRINAYPCAFDLPNIVCVGNYIKVGMVSPIRVPESNYGEDTVTLMADGEEVKSSCLNGKECLMSGSSMSTPRVAAELVKLWIKKPEMKPKEVIDALIKKLPKDQGLGKLTITGAFLD